MTGLSRHIPWIATAVTALWIGSKAIPPREPAGAMKVQAFGELPALAGGRIKPMDTVARTALMIVNDRQTFAPKQDDDPQPAIKWLLDAVCSERGGPVWKYQTFRIEDDQVLKLLGLPLRPRWFRYSLEEIAPHFDKIHAEAQRATKRGKERTPYDEHVLKLRKHLELYMELAQHIEPRVIPPASAADEWQSLAKAEEAAREPVIERVRAGLRDKGVTFEKLTAAQKDDLARSVRRQIDEALAQSSPAAAAYSKALDAYRDGQAEKFNAAVKEYRDTFYAHVPATDLRRVRAEVFFNHFTPFYHCTVLYVIVGALACLGWLVPGAAGRSAIWLGVLTAGLHTGALLLRMYIQGRPPVTNLYSSAVFIGWGCVLVGLILEAIYRNGLGTFAAGVLGFATSLVAHFLGTDGDTMEMLQAVLDTNFWLATHVTIINLGYTAMLVPGVLGMAFIARGLLSRTLTAPAAKTLGQMMYGIIAFATLLSFTGTVLGGIWADQSWGRFWGWDPKENGALLIVIWSAMILHARWGGMIKERGMAVLAVLGNVVTIWSWFGTNQLGVGLHAYGFRDGMARWIVITCSAHAVIALLGMIPTRLWMSDGRKPQPAAARPKRQPQPVG